MRLNSAGRLVPRDQPRAMDPGRAWRNTRRWRALSRQVVASEPCCVICGSTEDPCADHIISVTRGGPIWERSNLRRLCRSCNSRKGAV